MEPILINSTKNSMKEGINYLIKRDFKKHYRLTKKVGSYLSLLTLIFIGLTVFSNSDNLAILIAILSYLLILSWLTFLLILIVYELKKRKIIGWRDKIIKNNIDNSIKYYLQFDEETITISTDKLTSKVKWEYYSSYAEDNDTLHIMPCKNIYESLSFSTAEIGTETLIKLKTIVYKKLPLVHTT
jgi:hypothetical protein